MFLANDRLLHEDIVTCKTLSLARRCHMQTDMAIYSANKPLLSSLRGTLPQSRTQFYYLALQGCFSFRNFWNNNNFPRRNSNESKSVTMYRMSQCIEYANPNSLVDYIF